MLTFVLSGFLVCGLLFREYLKFGEVKPVNFLIRSCYLAVPLHKERTYTIEDR